MNKIKFKPELMDKIKEGKKLATVRKGIKQNIKLGPVIFVDCEDGQIQLKGGFIISIAIKRYCDLDQSDAIRDGFSHLGELRDVLYSIYGDIDPRSFMTVIRWTADKIGGE